MDTFALLGDPAAWAALLTLVLLEVVLGIDNLVFIAILSNKLPPEQQQRARRIGLALALVMRIALLMFIGWLVTLRTPLFDLGITGAPGAGKSTLAAEVVEALGEDAVLLPMDGFHLAQVRLEQLGLTATKGAIDTFDGGGFVHLLRRVRAADEEVVHAPTFRRDLEEPIAGAIAVYRSTPLVVVEGNYLLAEDPPWDEVAGLLDEVWFVPAPRPPQKEGLSITRFDQRVEMLELALAGNPAFKIDPIEKDRTGPSYTADTLAELKAQHPAHLFALLLGGDSLADLPGWYQPRRIVGAAELVVMARPGTPLVSAEELTRAYAGDAAAADKKYKGQQVLVSGKVLEARELKDIGANLEVIFAGADEAAKKPLRVRATMLSEALKQDLALYPKGGTASVRGECAGVREGRVALWYCRPAR